MERSAVNVTAPRMRWQTRNSRAKSGNPMTFNQMRRSYTLRGLLEAEVHADPLVQFHQWFDQAVSGDVPSWLEANAMTLSTVGSDSRVTNRIVLLKGIDDAGRFLFFTNYRSAKAQQIEANPVVALCFFWPHLERQVRICGRAEKTSRAASVAYFHSRPRGSQLSTLFSDQSSPVDSRQSLDQSLQEYEERFAGKEIPCPEHWGGYATTADEIEFWQGRDNRLHDRIVYRHVDARWSRSRLAP